MFPLGSVLLPTMVLPLRVFEYRYHALVQRCLDGDGEFGVCLIAKGSEVGGDDVRTDVGCVAQIVDAQQFGNGEWALGCVGTRRIVVDRWLPDDPYPLAEVSDWLDPVVDEDLAPTAATTVARLRHVLALASELGDAVPPATLELAEDPTMASYQVAALLPVGPLDRQRLLAAPTVRERFDELALLLADAEAVLAARLAMG